MTLKHEVEELLLYIFLKGNYKINYIVPIQK